MNKKVFEPVSPERRWEIIRAVRRGTILADPHEAATALWYARSILKRGRFYRLRSLAAVVAFAYILAEFVVRLSRRKGWSMPDPPTIVLYFFVLSHVYGWLAGRRLRENAREAERLNLPVAESAGLMSATVEPEPAAGPRPVPTTPNAPEALSPPRRPSPAEILLGLSVTAVVSLAMLSGGDKPWALFGLVALVAFLSAALGTSLAYRERELVSGPPEAGGSRHTKMLVGAVSLLFWLLMLVVAMTAVSE